MLRWDPRQGLGLYTELEEVGKGSRRCLGGRRVSQVEGNPERRGCLAILTRNSKHFGNVVPADRMSLPSFQMDGDPGPGSKFKCVTD